MLPYIAYMDPMGDYSLNHQSGYCQRPNPVLPTATEPWNHGQKKGNHPKMALFQVSEIFLFTQNHA